MSTNFSGLKRPHLQAFLSSAQYMGKRGVLFDAYDEPTYLGFWLDFEFNGGNVVEGNQNDLPEGLLASTDKHYSAQNYLNNIGYPDRAMNLQAFRLMLQSLTKHSPWYIQSIEGLGEIYKIDSKQNFRAKDKKITLKFLEGIDMRVTSMFDLYRKAAFDTVYMRHMLPDIMRFFTVYVYVTEFRTFHQPQKNSSLNQNNQKGQNSSKNDFSTGPLDQKADESLDQTSSTTHFLKYMDEHLSIIKFELSQCEFLIDSMQPAWSSGLKADTSEPASYQVEVKVGRIREIASYPVIQLALQGLDLSSDPNTRVFGERNFDDNYLSQPTYDGVKSNGITFNRKDEVRRAQGEASNPNQVYTSGPYAKGHLKPNTDLTQKSLGENVYPPKITYSNTDSNLNEKKRSLGERLFNEFKDFAIAQGQNFVNQQINNVYLGNAYGFSASTLINRLSENPYALIGAVEDIIRKSTNQETANQILANIYDNLPPPSSSSSGNPGSIGLTFTGAEIDGVVESGFQNTATNTSNLPGNASLTGASSNLSIPGNIGLIGIPSSLTNPGNVGLTGVSSNKNIQNNIGFDK